MVFCIKLRNAREETCNLIVVFDLQAEQHRTERDIIEAECYEMQHIAVLFLEVAFFLSAYCSRR